MDNARPDAALKEALQDAFELVGGSGVLVSDKVAEWKADDFLERQSDKISEASVGGANLAVET